MSGRRLLVGLSLFAVVCVVTLSLFPSVNAGSGDSGMYQIPTIQSPSGKVEDAVFAGGCFWCMEPPFDKVDGVLLTVSGYAGGTDQNPTYKEVSYGRTSHTESLKVIFDPEQVSYGTLIEVFWRTMDPTDLGGQFVDRGSQYRPEVFPANAEQKKTAEKSILALKKSGVFKKAIVVPVTEGATFWPAETYHQDYYHKDPTRYYGYRMGSGRDGFISKHWGEVDYKKLAKDIGKKQAISNPTHRELKGESQPH